MRSTDTGQLIALRFQHLPHFREPHFTGHDKSIAYDSADDKWALPRKIGYHATMTRRWLIRGLFLWLLLLCVGGWVYSIWYDASLVYWRYDPSRNTRPSLSYAQSRHYAPSVHRMGYFYSDAVVACVSEQGFLIIGRGGAGWEGHVQEGWEYSQTPTYFYEVEWGDVISGWFSDWWNPTAWWKWGNCFEPRCLPNVGLTHSVSIPYWLLTLVCLACLCFFWRRTRPLDPATAFPVVFEPTTRAEKEA